MTPPFSSAPSPPPPSPTPIASVTASTVATFDTAWSMDFLTADRILVAERGDVSVQEPGKLWVLTTSGQRTQVSGMPENTGIYYVLRSPNYPTTGLVYISYFEPGGPDEPRRGRNAADTQFKPEGLTVLRAKLDVSRSSPALSDIQVIWRQEKIVPIPTGRQISAYMAFSPDGQFLFICGGARDEFVGMQNLDNALGKTLRIFPDGTIPADNPFVRTAGARPDIWTLGHRNVYGIAFSPDGKLWQTEHGPEGGDEVNLIEASSNYGWPLASNGRNYGASSDDIPDHAQGDGFASPRYTWVPSVAPAGMFFYRGNRFPAWKGDAIIGGLKSRSLLRLRFSSGGVEVAQEIQMGMRIRHVSEAPDGSIWAIEDFPIGPNGGGLGRIIKLDPVFGS
ncbi:MAG TPA: PQQ-dependent sugar dehydrogenase [Sphingorhabdus sp.]|uniref:PQQ-dependent sugar dehydrogenase n=1 Tax=Sphingorhabdus sp. TaxID=1902408 RepID=UPI002CD35B49|nr:PQQ-dependent sugar dehydrogenase [Sphingorhabdus sp.]HQS12786.1 PQQ-dependent sugar dehydrogenase [Sphingorhabdus sp.]HQS79792.1 PQQ-dependent sugar dehydrogenase [Sphingorhabdus sp.]